jgi:hypothetical protein
MSELTWSPAEKAIARKAFEAALQKALDDTLREAKERVAKLTKMSELWKMEDWLRTRRRAVDEKYDYRYSVLPTVFARLLYEGLLKETDLNGLRDDKIKMIRSYAELFRELQNDSRFSGSHQV